MVCVSGRTESLMCRSCRAGRLNEKAVMWKPVIYLKQLLHLIGRFLQLLN